MAALKKLKMFKKNVANAASVTLTCPSRTFFFGKAISQNNFDYTCKGCLLVWCAKYLILQSSTRVTPETEAFAESYSRKKLL